MLVRLVLSLGLLTMAGVVAQATPDDGLPTLPPPSREDAKADPPPERDVQLNVASANPSTTGSESTPPTSTSVEPQPSCPQGQASCSQSPSAPQSNAASTSVETEPSAPSLLTPPTPATVSTPPTTSEDRMPQPVARAPEASAEASAFPAILAAINTNRTLIITANQTLDDLAKAQCDHINAIASIGLDPSIRCPADILCAAHVAKGQKTEQEVLGVWNDAAYASHAAAPDLKYVGIARVQDAWAIYFARPPPSS